MTTAAKPKRKWCDDCAVAEGGACARHASEDYHRLSGAEKAARSQGSMREPAIVCPACETQTTVADMPRHLESCSGPRDPHPLSRWITWAACIRLGVNKVTLHHWTRDGLVRVEVRGGQRRYLERDVVALLAARKARSFRNGTSGKSGRRKKS